MLYRVNARETATQNIVWAMVEALSADEAFDGVMDKIGEGFVPVSAIPVMERACFGGNCDE